jgi:hypothetical protein
MAIKEEFEILIDKEGGVRLTAKGFQGRECEVPLKKLQQLLAGDSSIQFTDEYRRALESAGVETKVKDK